MFTQYVLDSTGPSTTMDTDILRKGCIESGRDEIRKLIAMDIRASGRKRVHTVLPPLASRRTKRRRMQRDFTATPVPTSKLGSNATDGDTDCFCDLGEALLFSAKAVQRFSIYVRPKLVKWFEIYFLDMLVHISRHIQGPFEDWTRTAACILGEENGIDEDNISTETSRQARDDNAINENDQLVKNSQEMVYSYQDIKRTLDQAHSHQVLRKLDLSRWTVRLRVKLRLVDEFEVEAWRLISMIADEPGASSESDIILAGLTELRRQVETPSSHLGNVEPLRGLSVSKMTKEVVFNACTVRQWVVDLVHAERHRERISFIQDVVARGHNLPLIPALPGDQAGIESQSAKLCDFVSRARNLSSTHLSDVHVVAQYELKLAQSSDPLTDYAALRNLEGVEKALDELAKLPVLSLVEEKLAIRKDLLLWVAEAKSIFNPTRSQTLQDLNRYHQHLQKILCGVSTGRQKRVVGLMRKDFIDKEIRQFSKFDVIVLSDNIGPRLQALYLEATAWKERAGAVIVSLRAHGNSMAGEVVASSKPAAMVDCARMADLLKEYRGFDVSITEEYNIVDAVYTDATRWSRRVTKIVDEEQALLAHLSACRDERPRGVMIDPSRHVLDLIIDLLEWHHKVKKAITKAMSVGAAGGARDLSAVYSLIFDCPDVIEKYSRRRKCESSFIFERERFAAFTSRTSGGVTKSMKTILLAKAESAQVAKHVIGRLVSGSFDADEGYPLFFLLHLAWAAQVSELVFLATDEAVRTRPTLQEAATLIRSEPKVTGQLCTDALLDDRLKNEVAQLLSLVEDSRAAETTAKKMLSSGAETFRGSLEKAVEVRDFLVSLKDIQLRYKSPKQGGMGLILDPDDERSIDRLTKDMTWLVRTLAYPALHTDDVDIPVDARLPWSELIALSDRMPPEEHEVLGDISLVAVRVRDLHTAADKWQQQVSSLLSLSIRGAKRRHAGFQEGELDGHEGHAKVSNEQLAELVKDPILKIVSIPSENAVREILVKLYEFEDLMNNLLGKDFCDTAADRAPYPDAVSLVGTTDEFHLHRLTGNPLFSSLKLSMAKLSCILAEIAADTIGKEVFQWLNQCVQWIETLDNALVEESPFGVRGRLVLPVVQAARMVDLGRQLFLDVSEDIKKALSARRIVVSTNKQTERLTVTIAKGGAHHSVGGTVIKWCPLIFDCLKHDLETCYQWAERANVIAENAGRIATSLTTRTNDVSQDDLNNACHCVDDLLVHLEEGRNSFVVVPVKSLIDQMSSVHRVIDDWIQLRVSDPLSILSLDVAKIYRYDNTSSVIHDRDNLLDALLIRRRIQDSKSNANVLLPPAGIDFREKARSKLENKVMKKGMRMIGFDSEGRRDVSLYCTLKAWEIESTVFCVYREGEKSVTTEYTSKLTGFFNSLDPINNHTLCARVLANEVTSQDLLAMKSDGMASEELREKKAKAQANREELVVASGKNKSPGLKRQTVKSLLKMSASAAAKRSKSGPSPAAYSRL